MKVFVQRLLKSVGCWMLLFMAGVVQASEFTGVAVAGKADGIYSRTVTLQAGTYDIHLLDVFALGAQNGNQTALVLVEGDRQLARLPFSASGTSSARFTLAANTKSKLFVDANSARGPMIVSIALAGASEKLYEETFKPTPKVETTDSYTFAKSKPIDDAQSLHLQLTDFGAQFGGDLPQLRAFTNIEVRVNNSTATGTLQQWCWYRGEAPQQPCVGLDTASPGSPGIDLDQIILIQPGNLNLFISADAPPGELAQLGWQLRQQSGPVMWEENVMVNASQPEGVLLGEFTLASSALVEAGLSVVSDDISSFDVVIASAGSGSNLPPLNQELTAVSGQLPAGSYKVLLLSPEGNQGLVALQINAGETVLLDDAFSLGDFQRLGELSLDSNAIVPARLRFLEGLNNNQIFLTAKGVGEEVLSELHPDNEQVELPAGRTIVWGRYDPTAGDDLFRVQIGANASPLGEFWGVTAARLILHDRPSTDGDRGTVAVRNFEFPGPLADRYRLVLAQGDNYRIKMDLAEDLANMSKGFEFNPGTLHVMLFATQQDETSTVLGYRVTTQQEASNPQQPDRGSNGGGGSKGGGGVSTFFLYILLAIRILVLRNPVRS